MKQKSKKFIEAENLVKEDMTKNLTEYLSNNVNVYLKGGSDPHKGDIHIFSNENYFVDISRPVSRMDVKYGNSPYGPQTVIHPIHDENGEMVDFITTQDIDLSRETKDEIIRAIKKINIIAKNTRKRFYFKLSQSAKEDFIKQLYGREKDLFFAFFSKNMKNVRYLTFESLLKYVDVEIYYHYKRNGAQTPPKKTPVSVFEEIIRQLKNSGVELSENASAEFIKINKSNYCLIKGNINADKKEVLVDGVRYLCKPCDKQGYKDYIRISKPSLHCSPTIQTCFTFYKDISCNEFDEFISFTTKKLKENIKKMVA